MARPLWHQSRKYMNTFINSSSPTRCTPGMNEQPTAARISGPTTDQHRKHKPAKRLYSFAACLDNAFDDKRVTIACISVWFVVCLIGFTWLGIFGSEYMRIGPSPTLTYMGMTIQTMPRYLTVVMFVVLSTAINDFASDAIGPWIQNTVMDHKSRTIPYNKFTIIFITQMWSLYCGTMSVASIALVFAQFDLIMVRLVVDLFVNQYTIRRFLQNKTHDPHRYHTEFLNEDDSLSGSFPGDVDDYVPDNIALLEEKALRQRGGGGAGGGASQAPQDRRPQLPRDADEVYLGPQLPYPPEEHQQGPEGAVSSQTTPPIKPSAIEIEVERYASALQDMSQPKKPRKATG
jgi:hypothetical protein